MAGAIVGFDPAFASDPSAAVVVGRSKQDRKRLLVARVERWAPQRPRHVRRAAKTEAQRAEVANVVLDGVAALAQAYSAPVVTDQHLPGVVREGLRERGVDRVYVQAWTGRLTTEAFQALRARIVANTIELPQDETLLTELSKLRTRMRAGSQTVSAPRTTTSHMDTALALAAAVYRLETKGVPMRSRTFSSFRSAGQRTIPAPALADLEASMVPQWGMR